MSAAPAVCVDSHAHPQAAAAAAVSHTRAAAPDDEFRPHAPPTGAPSRVA